MDFRIITNFCFKSKKSIVLVFLAIYVFLLASTKVACCEAPTEEEFQKCFRIAYQYYLQNKNEKATDEFKAMLLLDNKNWISYIYLSKIEERKKNLANSYSYAVECMQLNPLSLAPYKQVASLIKQINVKHIFASIDAKNKTAHTINAILFCAIEIVLILLWVGYGLRYLLISYSTTQEKSGISVMVILILLLLYLLIFHSIANIAYKILQAIDEDAYYATTLAINFIAQLLMRGGFLAIMIYVLKRSKISVFEMHKYNNTTMNNLLHIVIPAVIIVSPTLFFYFGGSLLLKIKLLFMYLPEKSLIFYTLYALEILWLGVLLQEILFRRILYNKLKDYFKPVLAMALVSILFAVAHQNFEEFLNYFLSSLIYTGVYEKTKSIIPSVVVHSISNMPGVISGSMFF